MPQPLSSHCLGIQHHWLVLSHTSHESIHGKSLVNDWTHPLQFLAWFPFINGKFLVNPSSYHWDMEKYTVEMAPSCHPWKGRHWKTQEEVVQCDAEVEVPSRWQALADGDGCLGPTLEGDSYWEANNSPSLSLSLSLAGHSRLSNRLTEAPCEQRDQGTSAQPISQQLFACQLCTDGSFCSEIGQDCKPSLILAPFAAANPYARNQLNKSNGSCFFWHRLFTKKKHVPLHWICPPSEKLMVLRARVDQARTLWKPPRPERLSRAGSVFLAKMGWEIGWKWRKNFDSCIVI